MLEVKTARRRLVIILLVMAIGFILLCLWIAIPVLVLVKAFAVTT